MFVHLLVLFDFFQFLIVLLAKLLSVASPVDFFPAGSSLQSNDELNKSFFPLLNFMFTQP